MNASSRGSLRRHFEALRWVWEFAWSTDRLLLLGALFAALLAGMMPAAVALVGRVLVNDIVHAVHEGTGGAPGLWMWLVLSAVFATTGMIVGTLGDYWEKRLNDALLQRVEEDILRHCAALNLLQVQRAETQDLLEHARRYGQAAAGQVLDKAVGLISLMLRFASLIGILLWIEPAAVVFLGLVAVPVLLLRWRLAARIYAMQKQRALRQRWSRYYMRVLTDSRWMPEIKILQTAPEFIERLHKLNEEFIREDSRLYRLNLWLNSVFALFGVGGLYAFFGRVSERILSGALTVGDLTIYLGSAVQLHGTVQLMLQHMSGLREQLLHVADLRRLFAIQPMDPIAGESPGDAHSTCSASGAIRQVERGYIEFDCVSFAYPESREPTLVDVTFSLRMGETAAIVGENGAGKSTLAMLLAGMYAPTAGVIRVDGVDLQELGPEAWRQQVGFVFQGFAPYEATVRDNIAFGDWQRLQHQPEQVEALARLVRVDGLIDRLPHGYDTALGWQFGMLNLSGGQWQKLAIARGLARSDAKLLILDEPSTGLDAYAEAEIFRRLRQPSGDRVTILISHRMSIVREVDRILVLDRGRLVEQGAHDVLLAAGGTYATLHQMHLNHQGDFDEKK